ncbi:MAG: SprT-like domain-containing protein [Myxococcota bacterium]|nr:SprT-like domain-containing protein [Myxococcota bacterium]
MQYEALSAELERALLRQLALRYAEVNEDRFRARLKRPLLAFSDATSHLGRWISATRTIELARPFIAVRPWLEIASVLEHEMAHQFVDEVLGIRDESAHGETFRKVCAERGIDARAAGAPLPSTDGDSAAARTLERIRKLLALAASSNQHEAEIAMRRAHELMLRHNIEHVAYDSGYEVRHLGDPLKRTNRVETEVMLLLGDYFFVKVIRVPVYIPQAGKTGNVYEIAGTRANVEMAEHVYYFMLQTADRLWAANRTDARVRNGRDRLAYQSGVVRGFREKLGAERKELRGTGLVWLGDGNLEHFYRARHPRIVTRRTYVRMGGAHAAGREAGRTVILHKPVTSTSPSDGAPRLLRG